MTTSSASTRPSPAAPAAVRRELPLFAAGGLGLPAGELLIFAGTIWDPSGTRTSAGPLAARFEIDDPLGRGDGRLPLLLLPRPGPPVVLGWLPVLLAAGGLLAAIVFAWWQVRPVRRSETWSWT
jgi:hypothetical protein